MGRYIEVTHSQLEAAASRIESNMASHDRQLNNLGIQSVLLKQAWEGGDYNAFRFKYEGEDGPQSTGQEISRIMKEYAKFLRYCADQYKTAQIDAVNRADSLPFW